MIKKSIKRRLLRARITLNHTVQKILDINRSRKRLEYSREAEKRQLLLNEELRMLNKMAEQQARLIQHYEGILQPTNEPPTLAPHRQRPTILS